MMITSLKLIYVIVALETQVHIVSDVETSRNIFRRVVGRYSRTFELPASLSIIS